MLISKSFKFSNDLSFTATNPTNKFPVGNIRSGKTKQRLQIERFSNNSGTGLPGIISIAILLNMSRNHQYRFAQISFDFDAVLFDLDRHQLCGNLPAVDPVNYLPQVTVSGGMESGLVSQYEFKRNIRSRQCQMFIRSVI